MTLTKILHKILSFLLQFRDQSNVERSYQIPSFFIYHTNSDARCTTTLTTVVALFCLKELRLISNLLSLTIYCSVKSLFIAPNRELETKVEMQET